MTPSTGRDASWWQLAIESGDLVSLEPGEPWAALEDAGEPVAVDLSEDQRALLAGLTDQPPVARLDHLPDD